MKGSLGFRGVRFPQDIRVYIVLHGVFFMDQLRRLGYGLGD